MSHFSCFRSSFGPKIACFIRTCCFRNSFGPKIACFIRTCFRFPLWVCLFYFITLSLVGFLALSVSNTKNNLFKPNNLDLFFTSVSASTDSSMGTVEMEVFSTTQLVIMIILMLMGGEVFMSMLSLQLMKSNFPKNSQSTSSKSVHQIELDLVSCSSYLENNISINSSSTDVDDDILKYNSIKLLSYVVLGYLLVVHIGGSTLVALYLSVVPSAKQVMEKKGLPIQTFSVFTTVSTFSNCGFIPTNENMIVFNKNSGLLLILIPQALLGNTLYPACLRLVIWVLKKTTKKVEFSYLLKNYREIGYYHLLSGIHSCLLTATVLGFIVLQWVLFCFMEWNSEAMDGLNSYQKLVASLFEVVNSRYVGESVFDISIISPAILVLFVVMMYLPPYTSFFPTRYRESESKVKENKKKTFMEDLICSQLSYLITFIILVCITERQKLKEDPRNFSLLNITIEVISAYGNVGFTSGYSCNRRIRRDSSCDDKWYGFVGRWSNQGKWILILVMFFGRIKLFNFNGGQAWKLY
ncbi:hypothetical protein JRO89_XS04G0264900 [Xanthoceras sorbifolium]|uniref:Sodium transporter HKT1 n=1 Tax=Xanthoceras sorbifolium TaxID=99658 RepID=A0ABQ8I7B3_9ROSI|nr:hypothetical protein JRO89_XS04G0264900 [Xanthoceras sorbifolium]